MGERAGTAPAPRTGAVPRAPGQRLRRQPPARIRRAPASRSSRRSFSACFPLKENALNSHTNFSCPFEFNAHQPLCVVRMERKSEREGREERDFIARVSPLGAPGLTGAPLLIPSPRLQAAARSAYGYREARCRRGSQIAPSERPLPVLPSQPGRRGLVRSPQLPLGRVRQLHFSSITPPMASGETRLGGGLSAQDTAVPLVLLICSEMLYSGLQAQNKARSHLRSRRASSFALQAGSVARLGGRNSVTRHGAIGWYSADARQGYRSGAEAPPAEVPDFSTHRGSAEGSDGSPRSNPWKSGGHPLGLALAEWLGILAMAACVVLECILWRHDRGSRGERDLRGAGLGLIWSQGEGGDVQDGGVYENAPHHPPTVPTRALLRAVVSGGIAM